MNGKKQNKLNKLKTFAGDTAKCFNGISKVSRYLLIFGQMFIFLAMTAFAFYIAYARESSNAETIAYAFKNSKIFCDNAIAGLSVLWGGALFIDYAEKASEKR